MKPPITPGLIANLTETSSLVSELSRSVGNIRLPTKEDGIKGLSILRATGNVVHCRGKNVFGLSSQAQLEALKRSGVPFEVLD